jgi:hypothetical protein
MAATGQTPIATRAPPPVPRGAPNMPAGLADYLHQFALWARTNMSQKLPASQALPGLLLQAYDTAEGDAPQVFLVRVNSAGVISATAQSLGEGKP